MSHVNLGSRFLCSSALCPAEVLPDRKEGLPRSLSWRAWSQLQGLAQTLGWALFLTLGQNHHYASMGTSDCSWKEEESV